MLEVVSTQHFALGQGDVTEVMACGTALQPTEGDELTVINEGAVLHALNTQQYTCTSRNQQVVASVRSEESNCFIFIGFVLKRRHHVETEEQNVD